MCEEIRDEYMRPLLQVTVVAAEIGFRGSGEGSSVDEGEQTDLSLGGQANCYIVSEAGSYCFDCGVSDGVKAELLWEDSEGLISEVGLTSDGYVSFNASEQQGNALG